jgi:hypothetical protein
MAASRRVKFFSSGGRAFSAEKARLPQFCSYVNIFLTFFASAHFETCSMAAG